MKKALTILLMLSVLVACKKKDNPINKLKEAKENIEKATEGIKNTNKMVKEVQKMQDDIKELQEMEPLTNADFKDWMPEEIDDMKRTGYKTGQAVVYNVASAEATYKNEDKSKTFQVTIIDGAGETASFIIAAYRMVSAVDFEEQDERGYKKSVEKEGFKAHEEYRKYDENARIKERTEVKFLYLGRFGIDIKGTNMDADEVWSKIDDLKLKELKKKAS